MTPDDKPLTPAQARQKLQAGLADYLAGRGSEAIVFRLKRTKKASHTYPLKLTRHQRETLLRCTHLGRTLKKKMAQAGDGTQVVPVTWNELHTLNDEAGQAAVYAPSGDKKRLMAVIVRLTKFFEEEDIGGFHFLLPAPAKTDRLFQFKVTLFDIEPAIWRRVQVPDCTLAEFHESIQAAFGWEDYHLHQFEIGGLRYNRTGPGRRRSRLRLRGRDGRSPQHVTSEVEPEGPVGVRVRLRRRLAARGSVRGVPARRAEGEAAAVP